MPPTQTGPPIALTSLSIRNFRGIDNLDLDFRGPDGLPNNLVVLAGPNGSGKTAVLEAALIAVGGYKLVVGRRGKRAVRRGAEDYEIRAEVHVGGSRLVEQELVVFNTSRDTPPKPDPPIPHWYFSSWRAPMLVGAVDVRVGKPGRRPAKTDLNRLLNVKQQLANAAAMENFPGGSPLLLPSYSHWIGQINEAWRKFDPSGGHEFHVGLSVASERSSGAFEVFYTSPNKPSVTVDELSAGQLELFLFLAALVLNDHREGIVFIDEPELHLDPQWHAPIVRALMKLQPRAQFVVATHSPEIYAAAMSYERHFLVPEDDPRAWAWPVVGAGVEA